ncbi:Hypothetical predicted protein [Olea europaea subsp. europaea]|uniref:BAT2 N-terminal domain-containing protein n=1 Tax=Olea europaea subsp. europaea TaxID=158383 RepID=A0A8S0TY40_OLEEU|nr:Hypothetical predicted protein [Olea europaea subsp. europaea]
MASSMLAGERRWASARRGGMTVLGKVAVPKPLNLPSQRLENHGLDPNVEIVPKGTLSWGNRSSSSASNAWSSSMQSPNADGDTISPSHLSARPSSSGSCTRPSTAGSDRTHEPTANSWTPNSRPSSASGTLASNQTSSTSLRPRSAETRPNSSQLSRFAEPVSESSVAWGPSSAAGRLGVKSSKEDGFSLSSGDFPTLGSERDNSVKDIELQDHVSHEHPGSASGRISQTDGKITTPQDVTKSGTNNTWKRHGTRSTEDGIHPSMEKWQGEPQQYYHSNVPPQHFDSWRGPPINAPPGVWYRGPPGGPPFGAPVAPGGFPMEPFPYHRPQVVPVPLAGSQPVPPPGAAPRGPHPKNGDLYRTQMPDAYARPAMPFRPGFYPGPMSYDNYYRPPMGYCNGNEREIPYMGMAAGHPVFNRYPAPSAPDPSYSHGRPDGRGSTGKALSEKVEADHLEGPQGPHNIPPKNQKEWDTKEEGENWEQNLRSSASHRGKHGLLLISSRKTEWGADDDVDEDIFGEQTTPHEKNTSHNFDSHSTNTIKEKSSKGIGNFKAANDNWTKKSEIVARFPPEPPQPTLASDRDTSLLAPAKDSALMQKIEVLNAKVRATDGRHDVPAAYNREEQRSGFQVAEAKFNNFTVEAGSTAGSFERTSASGDFVPVPHEVVVPVGDKISQSAALVSRRAYHGGQGRVDHHYKGKFNNQDDDGWQKKFDVITASNIESSDDIHAFGTEDTENSVIHSVMDGGQPCAESYDSTDIQAQRAKMKETAKQRALELQKEEEERTREQKAKALAKLEELNRRTQAGEAGNQKAGRTQGTQNAETALVIGVFQGEQKETRVLGEQAMVNLKFQAPGPTLVSESDRESSASHYRQSANISRELHMETPWTSHLEHISHGQSSPLKQDSYNMGAKNAFESTDESVSRHKHIFCEQKPNDPSQKNSNEKSSLSEAPKDLTDVRVNDVTLTEVASSVRASGEANAPNTSIIMAEPTTHQGRKNNRYSKNKQRLDEAAVISPIPSVTLEETNPAKESIETGKSKVLLSDLDSSVSTKIEPDGGLQASEVQSTFHDEAVHSRVNKQWKPPSRRTPQSLQANRIVEKFHSNDTIMWAPVHSQSKVESAVEASQKSSTESVTSVKIDNLVQNSSKGKRAEMERYVPKPVAKELAQQGSFQPMPFSTSTTPEEAAGKAQPESSKSASPPPNSSATGIVRSGVDFKEGDGRHNKQRKAHGTWRQRNFTEHGTSNSTSVHHGPSVTSNPSKDIQRSTDQNQFVKREINAPKAESHSSRDNNTLDSSNMSNVIESAAAGKSLAVKDQVTTGRGKRYLSKGHKSMGSSNDPELTNTVRSESAATDVNQTDRTISISSKESHSSGERMSSHWQPKPNTNSENNQNRGRAAGTGTINVGTDRASKRDLRAKSKVHVPPQDDKKSCEVDRPHPDDSVPKSNMAVEPDVGHHQELFRERKPAPAKGRPYSPSQVPVGVGESAPAAAYTAGHDSRQHNVTAFRERQRQNVHYEYQPVGQYKNGKTEKHVASGDGSNDVAPRYRERNPSHSKRDGGNFHRRQGGPARINSGHD